MTADGNWQWLLSLLTYMFLFSKWIMFIMSVNQIVNDWENIVEIMFAWLSVEKREKKMSYFISYLIDLLFLFALLFLTHIHVFLYVLSVGILKSILLFTQGKSHVCGISQSPGRWIHPYVNIRLMSSIGKTINRKECCPWTLRSLITTYHRVYRS